MYVDFDLLAILAFWVGGVVLARFSRTVFGSYFAPASLYTILWMFSLGLYYVGLERFYALTADTIIVFLSALLMFIFGSVIAKMLTDKHQASRPVETPRRLKPEPYLPIVIYLLFLVGLLGSILYYVQFDRLIGIDSLWLAPALVRYEDSLGELQHIGLIGVLRSFVVPSFALAIIYIRVNSQRRNRIMWAVAAAAFLLSVPSSARTTIAMEIVWAGLAWIYVSQSCQQRLATVRAALVLAVVPVLLLAYFLVTTNLQQKAIEEQAGVPDVAVYTVSSFPAFQVMVQSPAAFDPGTSLSFGAVSRVLNELDPEHYVYPDYVQPYVNVPMPTNIYTYLDALFLDFGWFGVVIGPFILGLFITLIYLSMMRTPTVSKIYVASLMGYCIIQTTTAYRFGTFQTWSWILLPIGLIKLGEMFAARVHGGKYPLLEPGVHGGFQ